MLVERLSGWLPTIDKGNGGHCSPADVRCARPYTFNNSGLVPCSVAFRARVDAW